MQVLKDEIRHKILLEAELLFLQKGYDRTTLQMLSLIHILYVDEDMRLRLETKLIHSIVTSFKVLPV